MWFSFFHEAGHLLLHNGNKDAQWIDDQETHSGSGSKQEVEADTFAQDFLVAPEAANKLIGLSSEKAVKDFAASIGIAPGIVIGLRQRDAAPSDKRAFAIGNSLKRRIEFREFDPVRDRWRVARSEQT